MEVVFSDLRNGAQGILVTSIDYAVIVSNNKEQFGKNSFTLFKTYCNNAVIIHQKF